MSCAYCLAKGHSGGRGGRQQHAKHIESILTVFKCESTCCACIQLGISTQNTEMLSAVSLPIFVVRTRRVRAFKEPKSALLRANVMAMKHAILMGMLWESKQSGSAYYDAGNTVSVALSWFAMQREIYSFVEFKGFTFS